MQVEPAENDGDHVDRQEIHRVHQHNPHEHRERGGSDELAAIALVKDSFRLIVDELDQQLDKSLAAIRHARGRAAHHPPDGAEADDAQNDGGGE